jgi:hypothetical protein
MALEPMMAKILGDRDAALSLLILLGLAAPFMPLTDDHLTPMSVYVQGPNGAVARSFSTRTTTTFCRIVAAAMSYEDPAEGSYRRIDCGGVSSPEPDAPDD